MVTWSARWMLSVAVIASALTLTGCALRNIAYDVDERELVGAWGQESGDHAMSLVISADGTFVASSWPRNLVCSARSADTVEDLNGDDLVDFGGSWRSLSPDLGYSLVFSIESGDCARTGWSSDVWDSGSGELELRIFLDSVMDPDSATDSQIFWMRKETRVS